MIPVPNLWASNHGFLHRDRLKREAAKQASSHAVPISLTELSARFTNLRTRLLKKFRITETKSFLDFQIHSVIQCSGYQVRQISFLSEPGIRVPGNLFVPDGTGPFPAVLNLHGHWIQGKIAHVVQARGHILAQRGIVTLSIDSAGSGERSDCARQWSYHGAMKAVPLFLVGDSLMGQQIRDNRRALDLLETLPFVDPEKIGVTGASGGGNQAMWLSALDERVRVSVLVVSVGSFEAFVTERNCMCETLPDGLTLAEEWTVLGLIAPRPLLIINALHDTPSFGYKAMSHTCRHLEEVYTLFHSRDRLDWRLIDMQHGYHPPALQAMLGWMMHWLGGTRESSAQALPDWEKIPENELLCYHPGARPKECGYREMAIMRNKQFEGYQDLTHARKALARLIGLRPISRKSEWFLQRVLPSGTQVGAIYTERSLPLPVVASSGWDFSGDEVRLMLSPFGKSSTFVGQHWREASENGVLAVTADLPGVGELAWEQEDIAGVRLHDTVRACLWLGYHLIGEWTEAIASLCFLLQSEAPHARIQIIAEQEAVFASLLCKALLPNIDFELIEFDCPDSAGDLNNSSMAWCVPHFVQWGDLPLLRRLAFSTF